MNKEQVYDERIEPLMAQITGICKEAGISMLCTFDIPTEEDPHLCCTSALPDGEDSRSHRMQRTTDAALGRGGFVAFTVTGGKD